MHPRRWRPYRTTHLLRLSRQRTARRQSTTMQPMKNKTLAVWLNLFVGTLGLQRIYLTGRYDHWGWLAPIPTALGWYGIVRARTLGLEDLWSWVLIPIGGFTLAVCAFVGTYYGLMDAPKWNARFNPEADPESTAGQTNGLTVLGLGASFMLGTTVLMATIAFSFQRFFEFTA